MERVKEETQECKGGGIMLAIFIITTILFAGMFGYSLYVLKLLRAELKDKTRALQIIRGYRGIEE